MAHTRPGTRIALRASALFDPTVFHGQLTNAMLEFEQGAQLRETTVTGVLTPRDNFAGRNLTRLGLAEVTDLSFSSSPAATVNDLGGLDWDLESGAGTLTPTAGQNGTAVFTAAATPGPVRLELLVASGMATGRIVAGLRLSVAAPDDAVMEQVPGTAVQHLKDTCGVGFCGRIFLRPKDISFQNIQWSEGEGKVAGDGFYKYLNGKKHCESNPCNVPMPILGGNSTTGCKVQAVDNAATASIPPPFSKGNALWTIDWQYRVGSNAWVVFTVVDSEILADAAGRATISKKGSTPVSKNAADPTSIVDCGTVAI